MYNTSMLPVAPTNTCNLSPSMGLPRQAYNICHQLSVLVLFIMFLLCIVMNKNTGKDGDTIKIEDSVSWTVDDMCVSEAMQQQQTQ